MKKFILFLFLFIGTVANAQYVIKNYPWQFPAVKATDSIVVGQENFVIQNIGTTDGLAISNNFPAFTNRRNILIGSIVTDSILDGSENHLISTKFGSNQTYHVDKVTSTGMYPFGFDGKYINEVDAIGRASGYRIDSADRSLLIGSLSGAFLDSSISYSNLIGYGSGGGIDHLSSSTIIQNPTSGNTNFDTEIVNRCVIIGQVNAPQKGFGTFINAQTGRYGMDSITGLIWISDGYGNPSYTRELNSNHTFWDTSGTPIIRFGYGSSNRQLVRFGESEDHLNTSNYTDGIQLSSQNINQMFPQFSIFAGDQMSRIRLARIGESELDTVLANEDIGQVYSTAYNPDNSALVNLGFLRWTAGQKIRSSLESSSYVTLTLKEANRTQPQIYFQANGVTKSVNVFKNLIIDSTAVFQGGNVNFSSVNAEASGNPLQSGEALVSNGTLLQAQEVATTITETLSIDFPSISAGSTNDQIGTITGLEEGDVICMTPNKGAFSSNIIFQVWCNGSNTVVIRACNYTGGAIDLAEAEFYFKVIKQ